MSTLRRALGDGWIVTIPNRGYRLNVPLAQATPPQLEGMLVGKPSLAVLPFTNMSGDVEQEYFADGIAEEIITELSRIRSFLVIARNSSFTYKGRSVDVKQVAGELGVRYVLDGSVRRSADRIRIGAQLIDAQTGLHVWAERYDRELKDIFVVQDEIARSVIAEIAPAIHHAERLRAIGKSIERLSAWEAYQTGLWHLSKGGNRDLDLGLEFLHRATTLDPLFAEPHAMLARGHLSHATLGGGRPLDQGLTLAEREARAALRLDANNASALASLAWVASHRGDAAAALQQAQKAVASNVNEPTGYLALGHVLVFRQRLADGRSALGTALRLDPRGPSVPTALLHVAISHYIGRDYEAAAKAAGDVIAAYPDFPRPYPYLIASLGQLNRQDEAGAALLRVPPAANVYFEFVTQTRPPWHRPEDHAHLLEGLRSGGW